jgi:hypothetical protein
MANRQRSTANHKRGCKNKDLLLTFRIFSELNKNSPFGAINRLKEELFVIHYLLKTVHEEIPDGSCTKQQASF